METTPPTALIRKEKVNGNVRFSLYEFQTASGPRYGVELSIYSSFADQWKLDQFTAGLDLPPATELFDWLVDTISGYSWLDDKFVLNREQ